MDNIYIVAATSFEIEPFLQYCTVHFTPISPSVFRLKNTKIHIYIHGVGMLHATYLLTKICQQKPDFILQAGIAGALDRKLTLGKVVNIVQDTAVDIGACDDDNFISAMEMGLVDGNLFPYKNNSLENNSVLPAYFSTCPKVKGITQNTASGNEKEIEQLKLKHPTAQTESMEGASLHYVAAMENINYVQIRAISNYVEKRNKANWEMALAIKNLNEYLIGFVEDIVK